MSSVLYDANVLLDVMLNRLPFYAGSAAALRMAARGMVDGYVAGHAVTTVAYVAGRQIGRAPTHRALTQLLTYIRVAPVTDLGVRNALSSSMRDFEDAVTVAAAQAAGVELIVTRDEADFADCPIPTVLPEVLLARHN